MLRALRPTAGPGDAIGRGGGTVPREADVIYTVGHSTLVPDAFLELLAGVGIRTLWDVRSYPTSHWEWFRRDRLEEWLPAAGVDYRWVPALGGRRRPRKGETPGQSAAGQSAAGESAAGESAAGGAAAPPAWREEGFANYQWHMTTAEFFAAADELVALGRDRDVAIMCAEGVWWRCHRSMIADYLVTAGARVMHLQPRRLDHATVVADRLPRYAPEVIAAWRRHLEAR